MKHLNICVVEDDRDLAEGLADTLELEGHRVDIASTGEEAIEKFRIQGYDLTFMDIKLPGKNGVESFFEIRALKPEARVMMMTGYSMKNLMDEAMDGGALGVMHKPFDIQKAIDLAESIGMGSNILIIEDEIDFGNLLKEAFEKHGHLVSHVTNGLDGIDKCRESDFDVAFLDLRLNGRNGLDVFKEMKSLKPTMPIVVVTGFADEESESIAQMESMALTDIFRKPVDPKRLLECVASLKSNPD